MCGIFAFIKKYTNLPISSDLREELLNGWDCGKSRGPEHSVMQDYSCGIIGFHRLAINGLNVISNQPLEKDECVLICNGEIYNYKELYSQLNVVPKTHSDCEVIIDMYRKYGIDYTMQNLDGVFAFILIDNKNNTIYVARDPFGVRPMYYCQSEYGYCFTSEFKQLSYLCTSETPYGQFIPGSYSELKIDNAGNTRVILENKKYADFQFQANYNFSYDQCYDTHYYQTYHNLCAAVKKRVENTDRPIACLLSGGLDSSLIAALVRKYLPRNIDLETYSIGMPGAADFKYAQLVADHIGSKHTEIIVNEDEFFDAIPKVIKNISSYDTTTVRASVGNYLIGKYISTHSKAKVIFNGDGSDELTGGYMYFHYCPDSMTFDYECKRLLSNIHHFDGLRSDRCISSHGLESRTPFLDRSFVHAYLTIPAHIRNHNVEKNIEKFILRNSIAIYDNNLIPQEILWRKKEAFSDGVSSENKSWYEIIQSRVSQDYNDNIDGIIVNTPITQEQKYYRSVFEKYYYKCGSIIPYFWMPKFCDATDSSARTLDVYKKT
jgi:asparagine synthase (glutamine-hydrolysing)